MDGILLEMSPIPWSLVKIIRLLNYEGRLKEFDKSFMKGDYGKMVETTDASFYYLAPRQKIGLDVTLHLMESAVQRHFFNHNQTSKSRKVGYKSL